MSANAVDGPLVTIGIATYNRLRRTFPEALRSALNQTYPHLEVVVCDNASEDGTGEFMAGQHDPRLRYHRHAANIGANANFNACLELARGEYFLLLPDDDLLDPTFVARAIAAAGGGTPGVMLGGMKVIDGDGATMSTVQPPAPGMSAADLFMSWFDRRTSFYLFATLFRTEWLREAGGFASPEELFQDVIAIARNVVPHGYVSVPGSAGAFRRHDGNRGTAHHALRWTRDAEYLLDLLCTLMPDEAGRLRGAGAPYLASKCYRYVTVVKSPVERWRLYRTIDRRFGHAYAPWRFVMKYQRLHWRGRAGVWLRRLSRMRPVSSQRHHA